MLIVNHPPKGRGDERWETRDEKRETRDERQETGDGRWQNLLLFSCYFIKSNDKR